MFKFPKFIYPILYMFLRFWQRLALWAPVAALLPGAPARAQSVKFPADPIKFGQIDGQDLTAAPFVADSAAAAVVLCDFGRRWPQRCLNRAGRVVGPAPANVELPDGGGRFVCSAATPGTGTVVLISRLSLARAVYPAAQYAGLRELYRRLLDKQGEPLAVQKKAGS